MYLSNDIIFCEAKATSIGVSAFCSAPDNRTRHRQEVSCICTDDPPPKPRSAAATVAA